MLTGLNQGVKGPEGRVPRHNRNGRGRDQQGFPYVISYQPDWLRRVTVTRSLVSGRQSTKTLFRNPSARRQAPPGTRVRTRIMSPEQGIDLEISVAGREPAVSSIRITCNVPSWNPAIRDDEVVFTLENGLLPPA